MEKAKFTAAEIAGFFVELANSNPEDSIDNLKLNKLLYFAQGRFLLKFGRPLFDDEIQAWDYGPVVPTIYRMFKAFGRQPIDSSPVIADESKMTSEEMNLLLDIYDYYGRYTGVALKDMTHQRGTPWRLAYRANENNPITLSAIKTWFDKDKDFHEFKLDFSNADVITACPASWDSPEDSGYDV